MKKISCLFLLCAFELFANNSFAAKRPDWIVDPSKKCTKNEICASGSGTSPNMAKTDARNNILKYFETNVSSKFTSSISTDEVNTKYFKSDDMEEISSGILKGVSIKNTYDDGKDFYAFAVLDKNIAIKEVKNDIDKIDSKMKLLISENNIKYNKQLENLYAKRDALNKRYLILTGNMIPDVVKYDDIFQAKKKSGELALTYYIEPSNGYDQQVSDYLSSVLLDNGAKITNNEKDANRIVLVKITKNDLHMKVSGFIKQMYVLKIEVSNIHGETISSLYNEFSEAGRSEAQIKEIVNMNIKDYIDSNIEQILQ